MKNNTLYIFLVIIVFYGWLITAGNLQLFKLEDYGESTYCHLNGVAYDSLAKSFLKGKVTVEPSTILWEAFVRNGETYMYFGPLPALIRIIPNLISPDMHGRWSKISFLLAALICIISFALIVQYQLNKNHHIPNDDKKFLFNISLLGFGLGTPIITLVTQNHIYHESILWGLSLSICGVYFIISIISQDNFNYRNLFCLSFCAGGAILSKFTFGVSIYSALLVILIFHFLKLGINRSNQLNLKLLLSISPALVALIFQFWYNNERFGSITTFIDFRYHAYTQATYNPSEVLSIKRIPTTLYNYFGIRKEYFSSKPPYLKIPPVKIFKKELFYADQDSRVLSLTVGSPWLVLGTIIGLYLMLLQKSLLSKFIALALSVNILGLITFYAVMQRYINEFLPFMVYAYSLGLRGFGEVKLFNLSLIYFKKLLLILCIFSIIACILSNLEWSLTHTVDDKFKEKILNIFLFLEKSVNSLIKVKGV